MFHKILFIKFLIKKKNNNAQRRFSMSKGEKKRFFLRLQRYKNIENDKWHLYMNYIMI